MALPSSRRADGAAFRRSSAAGEGRPSACSVRSSTPPAFRSRGHPAPGGVPRPVRPPTLAGLDRLPPPLPLAAEVGVPLPQPDPLAPMPAFFLTMVSTKWSHVAIYIQFVLVDGIPRARSNHTGVPICWVVEKEFAPSISLLILLLAICRLDVDNIP